MSITDFNRIARQATTPDMVVGRDANLQPALREPLNPPGRWARFKAALSSVPVLGQLGSLQQARVQVDTYPIRLGHYEASNRQILAGFTRDLQAEYGSHVASMALRGADTGDGMPLSQRTVKTLLDGAQQAQKALQADNNARITARLHLGSALRPDEALGAQATLFITRLTAGHLPVHSERPLTSADIDPALTQALDTYESLLNTPDMTPDRLEGILLRANTKAAQGHQAVLGHARELVITDRLETQLNLKDPGSLLSSIARTVQAATPALNTTPPLDLAPVLKSIAKGIEKTVMSGFKGLPGQLGCGQDTASIAQALDAAVQNKIETALREHAQALTMIRQSTSLTSGQKDALLEIAATRRIDPMQVQKYEAGASAMAGAAAALHTYAQGGGDPNAVLAQLDRSMVHFERGVNAMKGHGATMWEHHSLDGGDTTIELLQEFARVAAHGMDAADAQKLLPALDHPEVGALYQVMRESSDMRMRGQLPIVLTALLETTAERAGLSPGNAADWTRDLLQEPPATGPDLASMRPSLAMIWARDEERTSANGAPLPHSPNAARVAPGFDPATVMAQHQQGLVDYVNSNAIDPMHGLPKMTLKDMGRATFSLGNERIGIPGEAQTQVLARFQAAFPPGQEAMARGVARCMNQNGIMEFVVHSHQAAYGDGTMPAFAKNAGGTQHEAWKQGDGTWLVRSTFTGQPLADDGTPFGSLAAHSVTYRVAPGTQPAGEAVITVERSQVAYAI